MNSKGNETITQEKKEKLHREKGIERERRDTKTAYMKNKENLKTWSTYKI